MSEPIMPTRIDHPHAWHAEELSAPDWTVALNDDVVEELLERAPEEGTEIDDAVRAACPLTSAQLGEVRQKLFDGIGFAVVRGVPVDALSEPRTRDVVWTLFSMVGRIVDQKHTGTRIYDVRDTGEKAGYGVRRSVTNEAQDFHTDGGWLTKPPECIGLFCRYPAWQGGESRVRSLIRAHNDLLSDAPELVERLYRDYFWDRQAEHPAGQVKYSRQPVFYVDHGGVQCRHYRDYVINGQNLAETPLDAMGQEALNALEARLGADDDWIDFTMSSGDFMMLNNRRIAHARTAFEATPEGERGRHLYRLWCRDEGRVEIEA
ncbi:MAG: TauD/TfdA family dioxygenase [Pseudomonadota bacterium]